MTENKRFDCTDNGFVVDYKSEQKVLNLYDTVDLLNEQDTTIKQLSHDATVLIQSNTDYRKENEQLKKDYEYLEEAMKKMAIEMMERR